jgi:hypothetical protein
MNNTEMVAPECVEKGDYIWSKGEVNEGRVKNNYSYLQKTDAEDITVYVFTLEIGTEINFSSGEQVKRRRRLDW